PKIPDYEIMSIPRDPGHSHAYQLGIGVSRINGPATFGLDAVYEPIWSNTYAAAAVPTETAPGDTIPVGGKTIENRFRFSNALFRMGVGRELPIGSRPRTAVWQLGVAVHAIHYWLTQQDYVQDASRAREDWWVEWTPTWGLTLRFPELELRYSGRVTTGTGGPVPFQSQALVDLGQALMFDKILSGNRDVACATCHHPSTHEGDGLALAIGTGGSGLGPGRTLGSGRQFVRRNAPSLLNDALGLSYLFWDGRITRFGNGFNGGPSQGLPGGLPDLLTAQAMLPVLDRRG